VTDTQPETFADPMTEVLRHGARALLAQAVETEVAALLSCRTDKLTNDGRQRLVRQPRCSRVFNKGDVIEGQSMLALTSPSDCRRYMPNERL
jgi:hypothetical protein